MDCLNVCDPSRRKYNPNLSESKILSGLSQLGPNHPGTSAIGDRAFLGFKLRENLGLRPLKLRQDSLTPGL